MSQLYKIKVFNEFDGERVFTEEQSSISYVLANEDGIFEGIDCRNYSLKYSVEKDMFKFLIGFIIPAKGIKNIKNASMIKGITMLKIPNNYIFPPVNYVGINDGKNIDGLCTVCSGKVLQPLGNCRMVISEEAKTNKFVENLAKRIINYKKDISPANIELIKAILDVKNSVVEDFQNIINEFPEGTTFDDMLAINAARNVNKKKKFK